MLIKKNLLGKLNIREIREGYAIMENGNLITILRCKKADLSLRNTCLFRRWIESLEFSAQISAITFNLGLAGRLHTYLSSVEHLIKQKKGNEQLLAEQKRFSRWIRKYAEKNCLPERVFYIMISACPYYESKKELKKLPNLDRDTAILKKRTAESLEKLSLFTDARQLASEEIKKMFSSFDQFIFYNNQSERMMDLSDCYNLWKTEEECQ